MNLALDETQLLLQETVRGFLARELPTDRVRELERTGGWDVVLWKGLIAQGWLASAFDEAGGGGGGRLLDLGIVVEELARRAAIVPVLECAVAGRALAAAGAREPLRAMLAGGSLPVPAVAAAAALAVGEELRGEIPFVDYGQFASEHLVVHASGLWRVPTDPPGVACEPLRSIGRTPVCAVRYERARAERIAPAAAAGAVIALGRLLAALQCVGSMQQALDATVAYAKVREQFGVPIGSFQAVRHHAAHMVGRVTSARILVYEALDALDRGEVDPRRIAAAKAAASRAAPDVTMLAHQIHGGNGVIEENDLYFTTLRAKERSLAWGSLDECLGVVAAEVHQPVDWM